MQPRLVIIGGGAMARAIASGAAERALASVRPAVVCEPDDARRAWFETAALASLIDRAEARIGDAMRDAGPDTQVLLATKPQSLPEVAAQLRPILEGGGRRVVISILAGAPSAQVRAALGDRSAIVRVMPNLAASIGMACSAICLGDGARAGDDRLARELFGACGEVVALEETLFDAFTALAGSGPAYVFYLAEAMEKAALAMGFDARTARSIVKQVVAGAGSLLKGSADAPQTLRAGVTSKGGTTAAATRVLDDAGVMDAFVRAIIAARDRGAELARGG